jgi:crotonobetainyl-CoA:carnitine CoA-transferase CaiB-like acyl-CoA transferase|tara:strand:+ start:106 stop:1281 length:1176 start_codon:yes stop_codon:yes gene_type:complete
MIKDNGKPLSGIRVIELGQIAAGPFASSLLADLGADVIKIENPKGGDGMRQWPPLNISKQGKEEIYSENFASINRNKRSMTLNIKDPSDVGLLKRLVSKATILIENYRPGVLNKLGLGYDDLKRINKKLIYCSISGYGQSGPYSDKGAFDVTVQAVAGIMSVTGEKDSSPVKCGVPIGDFCTGLYASYTIMAMLRNVEKNGKGTHIDCSMLGSLLGISALQTSEYFGNRKAPEKLGSAHSRNAPYQAFQASDTFFVIAAGNDKLWGEVCEAVEMEHLKNDVRFKTQSDRAENQNQLSEILTKKFLKHDTKYWLKEMDKRKVPCAPINNFETILNDKHIKHMEIVKPITLPNGSKTYSVTFPVSIKGVETKDLKIPPKLGEHNEEIISEWLN